MEFMIDLSLGLAIGAVYFTTLLLVLHFSGRIPSAFRYISGKLKKRRSAPHPHIHQDESPGGTSVHGPVSEDDSLPSPVQRSAPTELLPDVHPLQFDRRKPQHILGEDPGGADIGLLLMNDRHKMSEVKPAAINFLETHKHESQHVSEPSEKLREVLDGSPVEDRHRPVINDGRPPEYSAVMDKETGSDEKYGRLDLVIDGKTYSLRTREESPVTSLEDWLIPEDLQEMIADICYDHGVLSGMLYPSPDDRHELLFVGEGVSGKLEDALQLALKQHKAFKNYTIYTQETDGLLHTVELFGQKYKFRTIKRIRSKNGFSDARTATCELVLEGKVVDGHQPYLGYFVVVPAHSVLEESQCDRLRAKDAHPEALQHMKEETAGKSALNIRYALSQFNSSNRLDLRMTHFFSYRHYRNSNAPRDHYKSFLSDIYLLEIDQRHCYITPPDAIPLPNINESMSGIHTPKHTVCPLDIILPVRDPRHLAQMAVHKVCVRVGPSSGYMVLGGDWIQSKTAGMQENCNQEREYLCHAQFVIEDEDWPLMNGHSGSIVYVIDSGPQQQHYRFGMLVGEVLRTHRAGKVIYQAVVLRQALDEIEQENFYFIKNLQPMNQPINNCGDVRSTINLLQRRREDGRNNSEQRDGSIQGDRDDRDGQDLSLNMSMGSSVASSSSPASAGIHRQPSMTTGQQFQVTDDLTIMNKK